MVSKKLSLLASLFVLGSALCFGASGKGQGYEITKGKVSFDSAEKLNRTISLEGEWELYINKSPAEVRLFVNANIPPDAYVHVPGIWNEAVKEFSGGKDAAGTTGCYRIVIPNLDPDTQYGFLIKEAPNTSCAVFVNGELQTSSGDPFGVKKDGFFVSHSSYEPLLGSFYANKNGEAEIIVYINNYFYRKSGLQDAMMIGPKKNVFRTNNLLAGFNIAVSGLLLFIGFLNLIQYFINRKRREFFYLGLISLAFALRVAAAGYSALSVLFPALPGEVKRMLEYFAIWCVPASLIQLTRINYPYKKEYLIIPGVKEQVVRLIIVAFCVLLGILSFALPPKYANLLVPVFETNVGVTSTILLIMVIGALIHKERHIWLYISSLVVIGGGFAVDMIYTKMNGVLPISLMPFFLVLFSLIQVALLARMQGELYSDSIHGTGGLRKINEGYVRFVPREFIRLLENDSGSTLRLGDSASMEMSIMFSKLSIKRIAQGNETPEPITAEEEFKIFNDYSESINTIISKHNGFVTKYTNGGVFSLFPTNPNDAILAGIEVGERTKKITERYRSQGFIVSFKSGFHYGQMLLGTVGEEDRFDDAIISETVNEVSRIQTVCEKNDRTIVVSQDFKDHLVLNKLKGVCLMELATVQVKGKSDLMQLYDCMFINGGDLKI